MKPVCRCGLVDAHTHWVPAEIPAYLGQRKGVPWPSMAPADSACDRHVMIEGRIYRTVPSSCWQGPRRVEEMAAMGVVHQVVYGKHKTADSNFIYKFFTNCNHFSQ